MKWGFVELLGRFCNATHPDREPNGGIGVYRCMNRCPYRVMLPLVIGCVSGLLMIWDLHNNSVITSMGMAWDTGPPLWPYQASWIALVSINAPPYIAAAPLFSLFNARSSPERYPIFALAIVIWWWWLGRRIDFGLFPSRSHRHPWRSGAALMTIAVGLYCLGILALLDYAQWWSEYGFPGLRLLRTGGPMLWCFAIATGLTISAFRIIRMGRPAAL